ncbi:hypothetical protein B0H21DRAFT_876061 [Amylocystis lapponica]|nr:hypothetical protein B0H21DRAFT_876061 [Amylocystis lapponica]
MPAKYSHVKKRPANPPRKPSGGSGSSHAHKHKKDHRNPSPLNDRHLDRSISDAMTAVSQLERSIARILLIRFEQDMARLFSTHLYCISLLHLPTFVLRCITVGGPSWAAANADCNEIKDFFRSTISMDLRQAGERVATKSVLWSYTALRHFAMSHNVHICPTRGLHSLHLLPHYSALKAHLNTLEAMSAPVFTKPPHLGPLTEGLSALEDACEGTYATDTLWRAKVREGYERVCATLWRVAREFDVRGYGHILRDKLTSKWCDCGCSTDHLSEVCEKTVRDEEEESGVRPGKEREWDGRGSGVYGWETDEEEDVWDIDFDFIGMESQDGNDGLESEMTIRELMEWRYLRAEREKEQGNIAFKKGDYEQAIERYRSSHNIEPEMPHYQLNLAAAYLKIHNHAEAERACDAALSKHRSLKGHWRRAQARKLQGRITTRSRSSADLRIVLKIQPNNTEAGSELSTLLPSTPAPSAAVSSPFIPAASSAHSTASSSSSKQTPMITGPQSNTHSHNLPRQKPPTSLPFPRTEADSRRIQISPLPLTINMPVDYPSASEKGKSKKLAYFSARTKSETFNYPSWERYVVRRASD